MGETKFKHFRGSAGSIGFAAPAEVNTSNSALGRGIVRGVLGRIKWLYYTAADIHGFTVSGSEAGPWTHLEATVVNSDRFKMAQRPLTFVALVKGTEWRWPITRHELAEGGRLVATLGPME